MIGSLIDQILQIITGLGYWGILIGLAIEIIPSEIVLAYAGYLVYGEHIYFSEAVIFGIIGCLIQHITLYAIGRYGGRTFVERYGKFLHMKMEYVNVTERWFQKYGASVVFFSRFVPVLRQAISIPAGIAKMNIAKFLFYSGLATIPWAVLFVWLGEKLGENWKGISEQAAPYTHLFMYLAIGFAGIYFLYKYLTRKKKTA